MENVLRRTSAEALRIAASFAQGSRAKPTIRVVIVASTARVTARAIESDHTDAGPDVVHCPMVTAINSAVVLTKSTNKAVIADTCAFKITAAATANDEVAGLEVDGTAGL